MDVEPNITKQVLEWMWAVVLALGGLVWRNQRDMFQTHSDRITDLDKRITEAVTKKDFDAYSARSEVSRQELRSEILALTREVKDVSVILAKIDGKLSNQ